MLRRLQALILISELDSNLPLGGNQTLLPGETTGGVGDLPGKADETGVAVLPDEKSACRHVPVRDKLTGSCEAYTP